MRMPERPAESVARAQARRALPGPAARARVVAAARAGCRLVAAQDPWAAVPERPPRALAERLRAGEETRGARATAAVPAGLRRRPATVRRGKPVAGAAARRRHRA